MSFHNKVYRGLVFHIADDNTPGFIDENYNFYFYGTCFTHNNNLGIFEYFVSEGGFNRTPDGGVVKLNLSCVIVIILFVMQKSCIVQ